MRCQCGDNAERIGMRMAGWPAMQDRRAQLSAQRFVDSGSSRRRRWPEPHASVYPLSPCAAAHAPTSSRRIAAAIRPGNASGVHANDGTPSAASFMARPLS